MADIGWVASVAAADAYYALHTASAIWTGLTTPQKEAGLTTAYRMISSEETQFSIPPIPTPAQKAKLANAQLEYALMLISASDGGVRRETGIAGGLASTSAVGESYRADANDFRIPTRIVKMLTSFSIQVAAGTAYLYTDDSKNPYYPRTGGHGG